VLVCANVATLMLARAVARRQEMAVRLSLGASRSRLIRQLLTESLAIALGAGAASCVAASVLPGRIAQWMTDFPLATSVGPDWRVFALTFGLAALAACAAGVSPALESMRVNLSEGLRSGRHGDSGRTSFALRGKLVAYQLAVSLALLVCMGLVVRAQHRLVNVGLDYDPGGVMVAGVDLAGQRYSGLAAGTFYNRLLPRLESLPGVRAVALASPPPFRGRSQVAFRFEGQTGSTLLVAARAVSPDYFPIAGVQLLRGRLFTEVETRVPAPLMPVVVSEALVRQFLTGTSGVGQRLRFGGDNPAQIVGVVSDTSSVRLGETDEPILYRPMHAGNVAGTAALIRFEGDSRPLIRAIRTEVETLDRNLSASPETVASTIAKEADRYTTVVAVTAVPAGLALLLALAGIYGVTAFATTERTREIGIRTALGARPHEIVWLFLGSLRRPLLLGAIAGFVLAGLGAYLLERANLLVNVSASDPWAYGGALFLLICAAGTATFIPARRAAVRDPWCALRE
jgi:putative ABC transport system permease protein